MVHNRDGLGPSHYPAREYVNTHRSIGCEESVQYLTVLLLNRHAIQPLQVLQMDATDRPNHLHLGCRRACLDRICGIQDRCESEAHVSDVVQLADLE